MIFQFNAVLENYPLFLKGAGITLGICTIAMFAGFFLGILGALARRSRFILLRGIGLGYVNLFRNTPLLVQAYLIYFGLPTFKINLDSMTAGILALSINNGGYMTEIIRAGMGAIHRNESEAALALGMSRFQVLRYIVIPHVFRLVYLPMVNQFVLLILGSSILSLIGLKELTFEARMLEAYTFRSFEIYLVAMFLYIGLTIITTYILRLAGWKVLRRRVTRSGR